MHESKWGPWCWTEYSVRTKLTHWGLVMPYGVGDLGQHWLPDGTKPLPIPMLTYHQYGPVALIWGHYHKKIWRYQSAKQDWRLHFKITLRSHRGQWVNFIAADGLAHQVVRQTMGVTLTLWDNGPTSSTTKNSTGHYSDVIMGPMASQITSLTTVYSLFIQAQIKENIKTPRHWPSCGEFTGDRWIPRTKGQ